MLASLYRRTIYRGLCVLYRWQRFIEERFTPAGRFVLAVGFAAGVFGIDTRVNLLHQAFAFAVVLLLAAFVGSGLGSLRMRRRFKASRILPRYATMGMAVRYPVTIQTDQPRLLPGCRIAEQSADPRPSLHSFVHARLADDERVNRVDRVLGYPRWLGLIRRNLWTDKTEPLPLTAPVEQGRVTQRLELRPLRRGYLPLPALTLSRPDPLGLINSLQRLDCSQALLVLPRRYPMARIDLPGRRQYQPGGVSLASAVGDSQEFIGLREYRSGDSPRNIHWPAWARSGKPQVKEFQDEFFTRHALILDTFCDERLETCFEAAISVAASLCESIEDSDSLLDLMFVGTEAYCFTAGRGQGGTEQILEILACAQTCTDQPFERLQQSVLQRIPLLSAAVCVLLAFDAPRRNMLHALQAVGLPLRILLLADDAEARPALADWTGTRPDLIRPQYLAEDLARL
ncbi:MAG: DUF58 domain-containing protein [Chromatiales bacterium]|jgi:hypothetical protein